MNEYLIPVSTAYSLFPFVAAFFTLPYITYQYHKYGSLVFLRACIIYSFILYMICAYFYIIMPLPALSYLLANPLPLHIQLNPFSFLFDFKEQAYWMWTGIGTVNIIHSAWFQVLANMLLLFPFGVYLRYYFRRSLKQVVLLSFALSLFFECTQLSALYGLYPAPYRIFDIDDLIFNTLGGLAGYKATPFLTFFLPSKEQLNRISYERGQMITVPRRLLAACIDWALLVPLFIKLGSFSYPVYALVTVLYFACFPYLSKGYTIGKYAVSIRLVRERDGSPPSFRQYLTRYSVFYLVLFPLPVGIAYLLPYLDAERFPYPVLLAAGLICILLVMLYLNFVCYLLFECINKRGRLFYERFSNTCCTSTAYTRKMTL